MYPPIFKENYKGKGAWARAGAVFNRLGRFCNNINGSGGITITPNAYGGLDISGPSALPARLFSVHSFNQDAGTVTMSGGFIIHGMTKIDIHGAVVGIGGGTPENPSYVGIEYTYGGEAKYLTFSTSNIPLPTLTAWKQPIASFYRLSGKIHLKEVLWDSIIILPGITSPS